MKLGLVVTVFSLMLSGVSLAQTLQTLVHQPPDGAGIAFLLTDGTVTMEQFADDLLVMLKRL